MLFRNTSLILILSAFSVAVPLKADSQPMPVTQAETLSGRELVLPRAIAGHPAVIIIGFTHGSQKAIERLDKEIGAQVTAKPGVPLYNIAVIQDAPKFVRAMIKGGIKAIVPNAGQEKFLTVVQGQEELKKAVDFSDRDDAYIVVLDSAGNIVFHTHSDSDPSEAVKRQIIEQIKD